MLDNFWIAIFQGLSISFGLLCLGLSLQRLSVCLAWVVEYIRIVEEKLSAARTEKERLTEEISVAKDLTSQLRFNVDELKLKANQAEIAVSIETIDRLPAVYIASEKYREGDQEFRVHIWNSGLAGDWPDGREYAVWARSSEYASKIVQSRFPATSGYIIRGVDLAREPLV